MKVPEEIDLYDWYDYSFYRAVLGLPIPSPRVWDNAGKFGFTGGRYLKDIFFEKDFFEPSLYTRENLTNYIKEKYGNKLRLEKGKGKLMKADKSNHKFVRSVDNNHLYLNFESFRKAKSLSDQNNYQEIYEAIGEINFFVQKIFEANRKNGEKWIKLNDNLIEAIISEKDPIETLYENIYKFYDYPSKKLWELNDKLNNDFWLVDMFIYSFEVGTYRWLKGKTTKIKSYDKITKKVRFSEDSEENPKYKNIQKETNKNSKFNEQTIYTETSENEEKPVFANSKKRKSKSPFPYWLPFITIPIILIVPRYISSFRSPPKPSFPPIITVPERPSSLDICQLCKITNDCDVLPQCTTKQRRCEWKETWDGKLVEKCSSF